MNIVDKLAAVPLTLQYQAETLYLVPEHKLISGLYRVMYVNRAGDAKYMTFIGENTQVIDWARIEAENTAPHMPVLRQYGVLSQDKHAVYMRNWYAQRRNLKLTLLGKD